MLCAYSVLNTFSIDLRGANEKEKTLHLLFVRYFQACVEVLVVCVIGA